MTFTNGDGTEVDHKRDIDDPNKETKALLAIGGPEDGGRERGYEWTRNGSPKRARALARSWTRPSRTGPRWR